MYKRVHEMKMTLPDGTVVWVKRLDSDKGQVAMQIEGQVLSHANLTIAHALFGRAVRAVEGA